MFNGMFNSPYAPGSRSSPAPSGRSLAACHAAMSPLPSWTEVREGVDSGRSPAKPAALVTEVAKAFDRSRDAPW
jgi:hypothetical protein